ncbi:MAG: hypothetical protein L0Z62_33025 [Gemmataceae bacterium]|nr:hypothetical protein [Gemmataceae bacterium]
MNKRIRFAALDRLLADFGFTKTPIDEFNVLYKHPPSGWRIVFPAHRPSDPVDPKSMIIVRKNLDERGVLEADEFEARLRKPPRKRADGDGDADG